MVAVRPGRQLRRDGNAPLERAAGAAVGIDHLGRFFPQHGKRLFRDGETRDAWRNAGGHAPAFGVTYTHGFIGGCGPEAQRAGYFGGGGGGAPRNDAPGEFFAGALADVRIYSIELEEDGEEGISQLAIPTARPTEAPTQQPTPHDSRQRAPGPYAVPKSYSFRLLRLTVFCAS